jgi:hypothetical protein
MYSNVAITPLLRLHISTNVYGKCWRVEGVLHAINGLAAVKYVSVLTVDIHNDRITNIRL